MYHPPLLLPTSPSLSPRRPPPSLHPQTLAPLVTADPTEFGDGKALRFGRHDIPGGVLTAPYFAAENALVRDVLAKVPSFVAPSSFSCVSFFEGRDVPFATAMQVSAARELS